MSILSVGVRCRSLNSAAEAPLARELVGELALELSTRAAVPGTGSSSSESGSGVGLMSSRPVLEGREGSCEDKGGMGESCEEDEEMGLPSMCTSVSESSPPRSLRKGSLVRFSFRSISMRESRLCPGCVQAGSKSSGGVAAPEDWHGDGVWAMGGVVGPTIGTGGGSGIGGVWGFSRTGTKSGVEGRGGGRR